MVFKNNYAWEIQGRIPKFTSAIHIQSENNYTTLCEACFKKKVYLLQKC